MLHTIDDLRFRSIMDCITLFASKLVGTMPELFLPAFYDTATTHGSSMFIRIKGPVMISSYLSALQWITSSTYSSNYISTIYVANYNDKISYFLSFN